MKKLMLTKRLTALAIAFTMIFTVGTAFAFTAGILEINGTVNIVPPDELYVVWHSVDIGDGPILAGPLWGAIGVEQEVEFADARGRKNQVIVWSMTFDSESFEEAGDFALAAITALAFNNSNRNALVTIGTPVWSDPVLAAELGLTVIVDDRFFGSNIIAPNGHTGSLYVEIEWGGAFPDNFTVDYDSGNIVLTLSLELDYAPAAP